MINPNNTIHKMETVDMLDFSLFVKFINFTRSQSFSLFVKLFIYNTTNDDLTTFTMRL